MENNTEVLFIQKLYIIILVSLVLALFISLDSYVPKFKRNKYVKYFITMVASVLIVFVIGNRDYQVGVDTMTYKYIYDYIFTPMNNFKPSTDILWDFINFIFSRFTNDITYLFLFTALGYIILPLIGLHKIFKENIIYLLLFFLISPNFFLFGANGIRNGLAASVFLFSFRYYKTRKQWFWIGIASLLHLSLAIPAIFYFISFYIKKINLIFLIWLLLLIFAISGVDFLSFLPIKIDRLGAYTDVNTDFVAQKVLNMPISFIVYGIFPILIIAYYIIYKKIYDEFYMRISATYILANYIYIIAFQATFTVRFAYLSEFLMPLVILYPIFKFSNIKLKEIKIVIFMLLIFMMKSYKIFMI